MTKRKFGFLSKKKVGGRKKIRESQNSKLAKKIYELGVYGNFFFFVVVKN